MRTYRYLRSHTLRLSLPALFPRRTGLSKYAALTTALCWALAAHADPTETPREPEGAEASQASNALDPTTRTPAPLVRRGVDSIGSVSVGHPHAGFLFNAVQLPKDPLWVRTVPELSWGTEETILDLMKCIRLVHERFPGSPPVMIGAISAQQGGPLPPHKSHRTGRDADVYLFRDGGKWYKPATESDLDRPRTWALLRAFATETDVDMILLDQKLQDMLEAYALSIGEDPLWIKDLFHGQGRYPNPLVKHVPGHVAHMHVRFTSPIARERGRAAYDQLVELGHLELPGRELEHEVVKGDTLLAIAHRYNTTAATIMEKNGLDSTTIYVGRKLVIQERKDIRDAKAPVVVPHRRRPPDGPARTDVARAPEATPKNASPSSG